MLLSSSLAVWPVPGRSMDLPVMPPCLSGSAKEVGQGSPCVWWGLLQQLKRWRRGVHTSWCMGVQPGNRGGIGSTTGATHTNWHESPNWGSCPSQEYTTLTQWNIQMSWLSKFSLVQWAYSSGTTRLSNRSLANMSSIYSVVFIKWSLWTLLSHSHSQVKATKTIFGRDPL